MTRAATRSLLLIACFVLFGCESSPPSTPQPGVIYVDRPEVFTRERLLNRRLQEQAWLEDQLKLNPDSTFQGYRDVREFEGFFGKLSASFDPAGGARTTARNERDLNNIRQRAEIESLTAEMELARTRYELEQLKKQIAAADVPARQGNPPAPAVVDSALNDRVRELEQKVAALSVQAPGRSAVFDQSAIAKLPTLSPGSDAGTTRAELTSIEQLRDRLAYRNAVGAAMREQELDDAHDLGGFTLYTLKFDISVLGAANRSDVGLVELTLCGTDGSEADKGALFNAWFEHFEKRLQLEAIALQDVARTGAFTRAQLRDIAVFSTKLRDQVADSAPRGSDRAVKGGPTKVLDRELTDLEATQLLTALDSLQVSDNSERTRQALVFALIDRYSAMLEGLELNQLASKSININGKDYLLPRLIKPKPERLNNALGSFIGKLKASGAPYVYTVEPKELAQNVSDLAAKEQLTNLALSLNAALPGVAGANIGGYAESIRRSQSLLQGILRKPLIVGYAKDQATFGWLLGPRFKLGKGAQVTFDHTPAQHSVQATMAVPAWWKTLHIKKDCRWIGENGTQTAAHVDAFGKDKQACCFSVQLPADYEAITTFLMHEKGTTRAAPVIDRAAATEFPATFVAGRAQTIVIRGSDLWRNPAVFLGHQRGTDLKILPDMGGIIATFSLEMPGGSTAPVQLPLRIVTSVGEDTVQQFARLIGSSQTLIEPQIKIASKVVTGQDRIEFNVPPGAAPEAFHAVRLVVRPVNAVRGTEAVIKNGSASPLDRRFATAVWELEPAESAFKQASWWSTPQIMDAVIQVKLHPDDQWRDLTVPGTRFLHLGTSNQLVFSTVRTSISLSNDHEKREVGIKSSELELLQFGFPELIDELDRGQVSLRLTRDKVSIDLPIQRVSAGEWRVAQQTINNAITQLAPVAPESSREFIATIVTAKGSAPVSLPATAKVVFIK